MPRNKSDSNSPIYISADLLEQLHGDFKDADATKFVLIRIYAYHALRRRWPPSDVQKTARMLGLDAKNIRRHVAKLVLTGYLKDADGVLTGCWKGADGVPIPKKPAKSRASAVTINQTTTNQTTTNHYSWKPSDDLIKTMILERVITRVQCLDEAEKMIDHFKAKGEVKRDWDATYRNWIRADFGKGPKYQKRPPERTIEEMTNHMHAIPFSAWANYGKS